LGRSAAWKRASGAPPRRQSHTVSRPLSSRPASRRPASAPPCQPRPAAAHALGTHSGSAGARATRRGPATNTVATRCSGAWRHAPAPAPRTCCSSATAPCRASATTENGRHRGAIASGAPGGAAPGLAPSCTGPAAAAAAGRAAAASDKVDVDVTRGCAPLSLAPLLRSATLASVMLSQPATTSQHGAWPCTADSSANQAKASGPADGALKSARTHPAAPRCSTVTRPSWSQAASAVPPGDSRAPACRPGSCDACARSAASMRRAAPFLSLCLMSRAARGHALAHMWVDSMEYDHRQGMARMQLQAYM